MTSSGVRSSSTPVISRIVTSADEDLAAGQQVAANGPAMARGEAGMRVEEGSPSRIEMLPTKPDISWWSSLSSSR